jgi:hypothetical protein
MQRGRMRYCKTFCVVAIEISLSGALPSDFNVPLLAEAMAANRGDKESDEGGCCSAISVACRVSCNEPINIGNLSDSTEDPVKSLRNLGLERCRYAVRP